MTGRVTLRQVVPEDVPSFYAYQSDPQARELAAVPARDRPAFDTHWRRIIADDTGTARTILIDGEIAGYVLCFGPSEDREVGYWIGRPYWGRGVATRALSIFLAEVRERPLHAHVAEHNAASVRVLEKCGFKRLGEPDLGPDGIAELHLELGQLEHLAALVNETPEKP
jgi:RimJ/RimL family protein N-acetyltransferase